MGTGAKSKKPRPRAPQKKRERLRPVSLYPLDFDAAMRGLLASSQIETDEKKEKEADSL